MKHEEQKEIEEWDRKKILEGKTDWVLAEHIYDLITGCVDYNLSTLSMADEVCVGKGVIHISIGNVWYKVVVEKEE